MRVHDQFFYAVLLTFFPQDTLHCCTLTIYYFLHSMKECCSCFFTHSDTSVFWIEGMSWVPLFPSPVTVTDSANKSQHSFQLQSDLPQNPSSYNLAGRVQIWHVNWNLFTLKYYLLNEIFFNCVLILPSVF